MKTRYKVKGIGMEQTISSVVNIFHEGGKITKVQDKWNGKLPEGAIANVSRVQLLNPLWWAYYTWAWMFYLWSFVWWTRAWLVRRHRSNQLHGPSHFAELLLTLSITGFPQPQLGHRAQDHQCSQEQGGGRSKRQLKTFRESHGLIRHVYDY